MAGTRASGRKRIPDSLKALKGTLQNCRINRDAPNPDVAPQNEMQPPKFLDAVGKAEYRKKAELLHRLGVFREGDNVALAAYASAFSHWKAAMDVLNEEGLLITDVKGNKVQNPALFIVKRALEDMRHFIVEFGLTPASRQRLKVEKNEKKSEWDIFGEQPKQPPVVATDATLEVQ